MSRHMANDESSERSEDVAVKMSQKDIRAALTLLRTLARADESVRADPLCQPVSRPTPAADRQALIARATKEFRDRRRRSEIFGSSMFGEAGWDMLLALYVLDVSGQRQTVGSLFQFSGAPPTTANRWLAYLEAHSLVVREDHPTDRRTAFVTLTPVGRQKLDLYYSGTAPDGV